jgi:hypothetical protein
MSFENTAGLNVNNHYGVRDTGGSVGVEQSKDSLVKLSVQLTGASLNDDFIPPVYLKKGYLFKEAVLRVDEAFALTGTTPTVLAGLGDLSTNYISLSKAELEAIGTKVPASTGAGTLAYNSATGVTANAALAIGLGGTTPAANATKGKATLVLYFYYKAK